MRGVGQVREVGGEGVKDTCCAVYILLQTLEGHTDEIFSCAFNYEGDTIITGQSPQTLSQPSLFTHLPPSLLTHLPHSLHTSLTPHAPPSLLTHLPHSLHTQAVKIILAGYGDDNPIHLLINRLHLIIYPHHTKCSDSLEVSPHLTSY